MKIYFQDFTDHISKTEFSLKINVLFRENLLLALVLCQPPLAAAPALMKWTFWHFLHRCGTITSGPGLVTFYYKDTLSEIQHDDPQKINYRFI